MKRVILTAVLAMVFVTVVLLPAWSQRADRPRRVGVLFSGLTLDPAKRPPVLQALVDGLREHGWEEGRNVVLEVRYADLDPARLLELAAELGAFKVDVIMVSDTQSLDAARRKATKIPIVMAGAGVPVSLGAGTAWWQHHRRREPNRDHRRKEPGAAQGDQPQN